MAIRQRLRRLYLRFLDSRVRRFAHAPGAGKTVVFAPHQDDETLGCGGTILRKVALGSDVSVVFMTDGSRSHGYHAGVTPEVLAEIRISEAISACAKLGVDREKVIFLGYPDGQLSQFEGQARQQVSELLATLSADDVFIPYRKDRHPDHLATNRIVRSVLADTEKTTTVYEYITWFWFSWPLVNAPADHLGEHLRNARAFIRHLILVLRDIRCAVEISEVLELKRACMSEHKSQMERIGGDDWFILADVSDGEWLELSFRHHEVFHSYTHLKH